MKRTERHHIKENGLAVGMNKAFHFFRKSRKEIAIVAAAVVLLGIAFVGITAIKARNLRRQSVLAGRILELRDELAADPSKAAELEELAGRGKFARLAWLELAAFQVEQGEADRALETLGRIGSMPKDLVYYQSRTLLAEVHVLREEYDQAIAVYERIETEKPADYPLDAVLFHHAEALEAKSDRAGAAALYRRVQEEYPQTYFGYEASMKAARLGLG